MLSTELVLFFQSTVFTRLIHAVRTMFCVQSEENVDEESESEEDYSSEEENNDA